MMRRLCLVGSEFQVNTYTRGYQSFSSVAVDANRDFVVVWESDGQDITNAPHFVEFESRRQNLIGPE